LLLIGKSSKWLKPVKEIVLVCLLSLFILCQLMGAEEELNFAPLSKEELFQSQPPPLKQPSTTKTGEMIQHGKYLVEAVALCAECHTPRDSNGQLIMDKWLQGSPLQWVEQSGQKEWASYAGSLVGLPEGWKESDMVQYLETGILPRGGYSRLPMPPYRMSHKDALAITLYLESLSEQNTKRDAFINKPENELQSIEK